jgi:hypothetical protein
MADRDYRRYDEERYRDRGRDEDLYRGQSGTEYGARERGGRGSEEGRSWESERGYEGGRWSEGRGHEESGGRGGYEGGSQGGRGYEESGRWSGRRGGDAGDFGRGYGARDYGMGERSSSWERPGGGRSRGEYGDVGSGYGQRDYGLGERWTTRERPGGSSWSDDWRRAGGDYGGSYGGGSGTSGRYGQSWSEGPYAGRGPQGYQRSNERIHEDVCDLLTRHGQIDASGVNVRVDHGEVTLEGTVHSRHEKRLAEDLAEDLPGVREVHNRLRVESQEGEQRRGGFLGWLTGENREPSGQQQVPVSGTGVGVPAGGAAEGTTHDLREAATRSTSTSGSSRGTQTAGRPEARETE